MHAEALTSCKVESEFRKISNNYKYAFLNQWQTAALKVNKNLKRYTKAPPS